MRTVFEIMSQEVLPCVRAQAAKKLMETGLSQKQIAERLGLSQPAISQYKRDLRGRKTGVFADYPRLLEEARQIAHRIAAGEISMDQAHGEIFAACSQHLVQK
ncbi:MAG: helix-turn-helix domain-containing protein [Candidatus Aenigmarchaeota archaeon]|nr:helix-turn-helix domain-containing protein [Candidatus Aenigmarchaeota archaeon]